MARRRNTARATVGMKLEGADDLLDAILNLDYMARTEIAEKAIRAGMKPVLSAMAPLTPKSRNNRAGQSKKARKQWESSKPLHTTIQAVVREGRRYGVKSGWIGLVGPSYTDGGGHGNLFARQHKSQNWWGKPATKSRVIDNFVKRAADQSVVAASAAVLSTLRREVDQVLQRLFK
jgi:hypothetical protein